MFSYLIAEKLLFYIFLILYLHKEKRHFIKSRSKWVLQPENVNGENHRQSIKGFDGSAAVLGNSIGIRTAKLPEEKRLFSAFYA